MEENFKKLTKPDNSNSVKVPPPPSPPTVKGTGLTGRRNGVFGASGCYLILRTAPHAADGRKLCNLLTMCEDSLLALLFGPPFAPFAHPPSYLPSARTYTHTHTHTHSTSDAFLNALLFPSSQLLRFCVLLKTKSKVIRAKRRQWEKEEAATVDLNTVATVSRT